MTKSNIKKVIFFVPHADDLEFGIPYMCIESLLRGYNVIEVLMTDCQYGTKRIEFRGNRLKRIRTHEINKTIEIYEKHTRNKLNVIWAGFIDGHLTLNEKALNFVLDILRKNKPDIVFAPDPWYSLDFHHDHLNTGRLVYFALKKLNNTEKPNRIFFYYSFKNTIPIKMKFSHIKIAMEALSQHRSQVSPLKCKLITFWRSLNQILKGIKYGRFVETFRELKYSQNKPQKHKTLSIGEKIKYSMCYKFMKHPSDMHFPSPEELGLR